MKNTEGSESDEANLAATGERIYIAASWITRYQSSEIRGSAGARPAALSLSFPVDRSRSIEIHQTNVAR